ncbi:MAG: 1-acyl-sn-glycerol-3-phosphate acyltransferase [Acidobacteria bacterium]|nr:MAG: 1-acyl-sn-glycerol-3-phosphate acyltransferase [Acidobacteriota bacterium]
MNNPETNRREFLSPYSDAARSLFYFRIKGILSRIFGRLRCDVEGLEHVPQSGPAILTMNHTGWEEILCAILIVPRPMRIIGIRELMYLDDPVGRARIFDSAYGRGFGPVRRGLTILLGNALGGVIRRWLREFGFIPARVFTPAWPPLLGSNGWRETVAALAAGELVLLFPEGGYKRDGVMRPFKPGLGMLVRWLNRRHLDVPIVPIAQRTAGCVSWTLGHRYTPRLVFGPPLTFTFDGGNRRAFDERVARTVQDRIDALLRRAWPDAPPQTYRLAVRST